MRTHRIGICAALITWVTLAASAVRCRADATTAPSDPFVGAWSVTVTPDSATTQSGELPFEEMFLFEDGNLSASCCAKVGFAPTTYTVRTGSRGTLFVARMNADGHGKLVWHGTPSGSGLHGSLIWQKADGRLCKYTFDAVPAPAAPVADASSN